jgi:FkbO/Hyg5 family chorismatase
MSRELPLLTTVLVNQSELRAALTNKHLLGIVVFDRQQAQSLDGLAVPYLVVDFGYQPQLDYVAEVWLSSAPVSYKKLDGFCYGYDGENLFGCVAIRETTDNDHNNLVALTRQHYLDLFQQIRMLGYPCLSRIWNYIPQINTEINGLERYRAFCLGRNQAYQQSFKSFTKQLPAATGIAKYADKVIDIYFLAHKKPAVIAIENPQQTPAYRYPKRYSPKPPSFSRGLYWLTGDMLFISGTASILGSRSCYPKDVVKQCQTTLNNIAGLIAKENLKCYGIKNGFKLTDLAHVKIYYRHAEDLTTIQTLCNEKLAESCQKLYLKADLCRLELLVEIEAIVF